MELSFPVVYTRIIDVKKARIKAIKYAIIFEVEGASLSSNSVCV